MTEAPVARLQDATVRFGQTVALDSVSLALAAGDVVAVRGSNGSGKTTLLRTLAKLSRLAAGRRQGPPSCAYVPAALTPPVLRAGTWLSTLPRRGRHSAREAIEALDALGFDGDLAQPCRSLSFGNLRKLLLAEACSAAEQLVIVDELSAGLDRRGIAGTIELLTRLRGRGCAVVLADQQDRPVPLANRQLVLEQGRVVEHPVEPSRPGAPPRDDQQSRPPTTVEVTLVGPESRRGELERLAAAVGFSPTPPRDPERPRPPDSSKR